MISASANGLMIKTLAETSDTIKRFRKRPRKVCSIITMQFMNMSSLYAPHYIKGLTSKVDKVIFTKTAAESGCEGWSLVRPLAFFEVDALYRALAVVGPVVVFSELAQDEAAV